MPHRLSLAEGTPPTRDLFFLLLALDVFLPFIGILVFSFISSGLLILLLCFLLASGSGVCVYVFPFNPRSFIYNAIFSFFFLFKLSSGSGGFSLVNSVSGSLFQDSVISKVKVVDFSWPTAFKGP